MYDQRRPCASKLLGALVAGALLSLSTACGKDDPLVAGPPVLVQLIAFNDFHGNLEAPSGSTGRIKAPTTGGGTVDVNAGGATYFAHHVAKLRERNPQNTVVVSAGDLINASPLVSAIFHDEPTIEVMNMIGLDFNSVGNHEFDDGKDELLRMQNGGCHPVEGCTANPQFPGAKFKFLAANVFTDVAAKQTLLPAYDIRTFDGVKVAFIGMTLEGTAGIVDPAGIVGLTFQDEADTVNALIPELKAQGVETIVVLIHEGGFPPEGKENLYNECVGISGPIIELAERFDDAVDVIVSGHTHQAYNCVIDGKRVTSAASNGRVLTYIDLTLDPVTRDVAESAATNIIVTRDNANTPVDAFVKDYVRKAAPLANRVIGRTPVDLKAPPRPLPAGSSGESVLGNLIADAMLEATKDESKGGAVIAFQNPGSVRADITAGDITYGKAFAVQPFSNNLTTMTLTGAQIKDMLEEQFQASATNILQVSAGFSFSWKESAPMGSKIDPASIQLNGVAIDPAASYRVTVNSFLAGGGDSFKTFTKGTALLTGSLDLTALEAYFRAHDPVTPPALGRITRVP